ncbi:MAG: electron transport complex subunit RsxC [Colwellia sp.]
MSKGAMSKGARSKGNVLGGNMLGETVLSYFKKPFKGGIHPKSCKELTQTQAIESDFKPARIYLSLQQRNGTMLISQVEVGELVGKGQLIGKGSSDFCVPLHSPINGRVEAIKDYVSAHPSGIKCKTIIIKADDRLGWATNILPSDPTKISPEEMIQRVLDAGVVGLGGGGFSTGLKMRLARSQKVHTLLINGGECEPYLTCDDRLMQEKATEIVAGVALMILAVGCKQAIIAIEDNKPESIRAIKSACEENDAITVKIVPSLYPMGSELHLIKAVTGKALPPGVRSTSLGILVNNVATARAVYHAIRFQRPLIDRVFTVSGGGIENPRNLVVPVGTQVSDLLQACGGLTMSARRLIAGGPMMGQVIPSHLSPLDKSIGGLLVLNDEEVRQEQSHDCIRCGRCVKACPMGLMPFQMAALSRNSDYESLQDYGIENCLFCGACSYVCPSNISLVQQFMHSRGQINSQRNLSKKMIFAKQLAEAKTERMAKELAAKKAVKAAKAAAKAEKAKKKTSKRATRNKTAGEN